jgi:hypothetical protein
VITGLMILIVTWRRGQLGEFALVLREGGHVELVASVPLMV